MRYALQLERTSVHDALAQTGMFGEQYSPETRALMQFLADNIRKPHRMSDFILAYTAALGAAGNPNQTSLLGGVTAPTKSDLINAAIKTTQKDSNAQKENSQRDIFSQNASVSKESGKQPTNEKGHSRRAESTQSQVTKDKPKKKSKLNETEKPALQTALSAFVSAPDGSNDFGQINKALSKAIRRQAAPIRLRVGNEAAGLNHINRPVRLAQIQRAGYSTAEAFVADVATNFDAIHKGRGSALFLVKKSNTPNRTLVVRLEPGKDGDFYDVKTALVSRPDFMSRKELLWDRAQSNQSALSEFPSAISGQSTNTINHQRAHSKVESDTRQAKPDTALESRQPHNNEGVDIARAQRMVDRVVGNIPDSSDISIKVVESRFDVEDIEGHLPSMNSEGIYFPASKGADGKTVPARIYLMANSLASMVRAQQVLAHELVGHFGMEALLGDKFSSVLLDVKRLTKVPNGVKIGLQRPGDPYYATMDAVAMDYPDYSPANQAREVLARMAEMNIKPSFLERVYTYIRRFFRTIGLNVPLSVSEIKNMVVDSAKRLREVSASQSVMGALSAAESLRAAEARNGDIASVARKLIELADENATAPGPSTKVVYRKVAQPLVEIARAAKLNIEGFTHIIDSSAVRHIMKMHSNAKVELRRGNLPVSNKDISAIPQVVDNPDKVIFGQKNKMGRDLVIYLKRMPDNTTLYLEEVRTGRKEMAAHTMRKYPATTPDSSIITALRHIRSKPASQGDLIVVEGPISDKDLESRITQTSSPAFKKWFGDSKVVDADGKPLVVYHGTLSNFSEFQNHKGIYFTTPDADFAARFTTEENGGYAEGAQILPVYVAATNPFDYENKKHVGAIAIRAGLTRNAVNEIKKGKWQRLEDRTVLEAIKDAGFDGLYVNEDGVKNLAVFSPKQIKSATGNRGTFDASNPSILESRAAVATDDKPKVATSTAQEKWLAVEAKARGFKNIDDLADKNFPLFEKLAALWVKKQEAGPTASERADAIINDKVKVFGLLEKPLHAITKGVRIEKLTNAIYNKAGFLLDRYTPEVALARVYDLIFRRRDYASQSLALNLWRSARLVPFET